METNRLHQACVQARRSDRFIDLVDTNFGHAGIRPDEELYRFAWENWRADPAYHPDAPGRITTRESIAAWYRENGLEIDPGRILLTAGSSISYHLIFSALAGAGSGEPDQQADRRPEEQPDQQADRRPEEPRPVALPVPSYPLFEELTAMNGLAPVWYRLDPDAGYRLDRDSVLSALGTNPCCLVIISPNNPTGTVLPDDDVRWVTAQAGAAGIPIIADEVFSTFLWSDAAPGAVLPRPASFALESNAVVITINGVSKIGAAPEVKLGWIAVSGPGKKVQPLVERLEYLHDAYLSVSGFAEHFAEILLTRGRAFMETVRRTVAGRRDAAVLLLRDIPGIRIVEPAGGIHLLFCLCRDTAVRAFGTSDDEEIAVILLNSAQLYLHPGYLYGIDEIDPCFVMSFLAEPERTREGIERLNERIVRTRSV